MPDKTFTVSSNEVRNRENREKANIAFQDTSKGEAVVSLLEMMQTYEVDKTIRLFEIEESIALKEFDLKFKDKLQSDSIKTELKSLKAESEAINKTLKQIGNDVLSLEKTLKSYKKVDIESYINNYKQISNDKSRGQVIVENEQPKPEINQTKIEPKDNNKLKEKKEDTKIKSKNSVNVKGEKCEVREIFNDQKSIGKETVLSPYFSYTPPTLVSYFKSNAYMNVSASVNQSKKQKSLIFKIVFKSKDVKKSYGTIKKNEFLRIEFNNGKKIFLKAKDNVEPQLEEYTGYTVYLAEYVFSSSEDYGLVKSYFVDKIGIMWTSGFEAYTIYKIDFLKNAIKCLENEN